MLMFEKRTQKPYHVWSIQDKNETYTVCSCLKKEQGQVPERYIYIWRSISRGDRD